MKVSVYTDGGSRGNPGHSGFGVVIYDEKKQIVAKLSKYIGIRTNNEAEYSALIDSLLWLRDNSTLHSISAATFYSDSQLMVRQLQGKYKVKAQNIKPLFNQAKSLLDSLKLTYQFSDIPREQNSLADSLANQAMDRKS
ncbi:ribonuclease HI family protein [Candidatus Shapirobacteria bacterium]|nr:ribonuclease HI family protein [Candidatus Shapirobacteria bacterium]